MADLTPEEIALGLRAAKAGWRFEPGDILRNVVHGGGSHYAGQAVMLQRVDPLTGELRYIGAGPDATPMRDRQDGTIDHGPDMSLRGWTFIPDPTHRGFVSAALTQVRERTGDSQAHVRGWTSRYHDPPKCWDVIVRGRECAVAPSEAEAVVAALEATR